MPAFTLREDDPESFRIFVATLDRNDEKTVAAYLTTLRDLAAWLATQPDGTPFHPALLTVTALEGYIAHLEAEQRAPRTALPRDFLVLADKTRFGHADGGDVGEYADMARRTEAARMRHALPVIQQQVRRELELLQRLQHRRHFPEREQPGNIGENPLAAARRCLRRAPAPENSGQRWRRR